MLQELDVSAAAGVGRPKASEKSFRGIPKAFDLNFELPGEPDQASALLCHLIYFMV